MNRKNLRTIKRLEIRQRLQAGEPVEVVVKAYPFIQPRKLSMRAH